MSMGESTRAWLDDNFRLDELIGFLRKKTVPVHRLSYFYFLGGMTLLLFGIQADHGNFAAALLPTDARRTRSRACSTS